MSLFDQFDQEILGDFITEACELLETMDQDLVELEQNPTDLELLNRIFRALHTVKGSSGFLGLTTITEFAHAAEDALNALRKGQVRVTRSVMDALLAAGDVVKRMMVDIKELREPAPGPVDLMAQLRRLGKGESIEDGCTPGNASAIDQPLTGDASDIAPGEGDAMLDLPASRLDLLPYMIEELLDSLNQFHELIEHTRLESDHAPLQIRMREIIDGLLRCIEFFEIDILTREVRALSEFTQALTLLTGDALNEARLRADAVITILRERSEAMLHGRLPSIPTDVLLERLSRNLVGESLALTAEMAAACSAQDILRVDGVRGQNGNGKCAALQSSVTENNGSGAEDSTTASEDSSARDERGRQSQAKASAGGEQTIRVDVERLESLLNLVGELVLQKNRVAGLSRRLGQMDVDHEYMEAFTQVASDLDRITGELQQGVMKTRMQPLNKLFSRYPRLIRDLSRIANKEIDLQILGGETEVDKSVIELLGDPLVHILRNSVDHGLEPPEEREAAGKARQGTIAIGAGHEGNHVIVTIRDDGRGLDRGRIARKAVERGLATADEVAGMSDQQIFKFIFLPGFSTAQVVSDLSGRGVGMDVVKTNISKMGGMIDVDSQAGAGTTVSIKIPLTVAIMQAMMVEVGKAVYALPLGNILEIVRLDADVLGSIQRRPVLRLRDSVLPLVHVAGLFNEGTQTPRYAVVVGLGSDRLGLLVNQVLGQEEAVIKSIDDHLFEGVQYISGATVREDGKVCLILDIAALLRMGAEALAAGMQPLNLNDAQVPMTQGALS